MKKELKDYLHLYLGAQYRVRYIDYQSGQWTVWSELTPYRLTKLDDHSIAEIQLKLRPLSDMTEEERNEFLEQCGLEPEDIDCLIKSPDNFFPDNEMSFRTAHLTNIAQWAVGVKYLLSKYFDLFQLIESGLAIDESTLNL